MKSKNCSIKGCEHKAIAKGFCRQHYDHQRGNRAKNPPKRFSDSEVEEIRSLRREGALIKPLAEQFNVHKGVISRLLNGKTYRKCQTNHE